MTIFEFGVILTSGMNDKNKQRIYDTKETVTTSSIELELFIILPTPFANHSVEFIMNTIKSYPSKVHRLQSNN